MPGPDAGHPLQGAGSYQYLPACALSGGSNDYLVAYAKVSLKKYRPIAARNEEANVSRGLL